MAAFLFIPVGGEAGLARRVDFANIGELFTEIEEPPRAEGRGRVLRVLIAALLFLLAFGDMLLVARPGILSMAASRPAPSATGRTVTL